MHNKGVLEKGRPVRSMEVRKYHAVPINLVGYPSVCKFVCLYVALCQLKLLVPRHRGRDRLTRLVRAT